MSYNEYSMKVQKFGNRSFNDLYMKKKDFTEVLKNLINIQI